MKLRCLGYVLLRSSLVFLVLMLWLQWPLRVFSVGDARFVNDLGQIAFAFFTVVAFADATRHQSHLTIHSTAVAVEEKKSKSQWLKHLVLLAWALFIVHAAWPLWVHSFQESEKFPDTYTRGFYFIKLALLLFPLSLVFYIANAFIKAVRDEP